MKRFATLALGLMTASAVALTLAATAAAQVGPQPPGPGLGPRGEFRGPPEPGRGRPRAMELLDTDRDGKVSLAEITAEQGRLIAAADVDGDGKLSIDEFRRRGRLFQALGTTTLFDLIDVDGDRSLSAEELAKPSERWCSRTDANADGLLDPEEFPSRRHRRFRR